MRRYTRFSLRSLLLLLTTVAIIVGSIKLVNRATKIRQENTAYQAYIDKHGYQPKTALPGSHLELFGPSLEAELVAIEKNILTFRYRFPGEFPRNPWFTVKRKLPVQPFSGRQFGPVSFYRSRPNSEYIVHILENDGQKINYRSDVLIYVFQQSWQAY